MGRMNNPGKGVSQSALPYRRSAPTWVTMTAEQVEDIIEKLARKGMSASEIGVNLRDCYGIPQARQVTGKTILQTLRAKGLSPSLPEDLHCLLKKAECIKKHMEHNAKDKGAKSRLVLVESQIHRLVRHYKEKETLPGDWKYDSKKASALVV